MERDGIAFSLTDTFISKYKGKQPKWGPLGYFVFKRTYSRNISERKSEEFWQTLQRVVEGCFLVQKLHCKNYHLPWYERKAQKSAQEMFKRMWDFKFLPPGRGLWAMGTDFVFDKGAASLQNCGAISTKGLKLDFSAPFVWLMEMSFLGVGVGFDVLGAQEEVYLKTPRESKDVHVVSDSREGWVEAFKRVLDAFYGKDSLPAGWDYSQIRPEGTPIKGFGGTAPGPQPLIELIERTTKYLWEYVNEDKPVDSTLIVDIMNFAGAAVVAGGLRRSSELALGLIEDEDYLNLKSVEHLQNPELARWASNNSLTLQKGANYSEIADQIAINGEPGCFWIENAQQYGRMSEPPNNKDYRCSLLNPCGEQTLEGGQGGSGGELCNLGETFPSKHDSLEDYLLTLKYAYLYCKSVTLLKTHDAGTNSIMARNRRIGVSQTGIVENINKIGFREHIKWCDTGYKEIKKWDKVYSEWLGIPESIKCTTVKPSGSVALLPGVTPGIHFPHSEYYIRRIRVAKSSDLWKVLEEAGYPVEPDINQPDYTMIVSFPVHENYFSRRKADISMWEQLELAAQMQAYWSDNAVSITVTIKPKEKQDLARALSMYESRLKSVSFLPLTDHQYKQAPYEEITEEEYKELTSKLKRYKLGALDEEDKIEEKFCDGDVCVV